MSNILTAFVSLVSSPNSQLESVKLGSNRINHVGDSLEAYVKRLFYPLNGNIGLEGEMYADNQIFSYLGNKNNPPDAILKHGDAIEVKKIESLGAALALNSSHPKAKLYQDCSLITEACRNVDNGDWIEKDLIYIVGVVGDDDKSKNNKILKGIWFVYGDCYAASREVYEKVTSTMIDGIRNIPTVELSKTNELARVNKVDPLGITYLRVRGMWGIDNPIKVFNYLKLDTSDFFAHAIMRKDKFDSFPEHSRDAVMNLKNRFFKDSELAGGFTVSDREIKNPDNPAEMIDIVILSYTK